MYGRASLGEITGHVFLLFLLLLAPGCVTRQSDESSWPLRPPSWQPILSDGEVAIVRQTFPEFHAEIFASGFNPNGGAAYTPGNFSPALFFGVPLAEGMKPTPAGVMLETNGYDGSHVAELLPPKGTYFDRFRNPYEFELGSFVFDPLDQLEARMGVSRTPGAPRITVDRRKVRVDPSEVDRILLGVRQAIAQRFPEIAGVDPRRCEVVIEPTTFYATGTNYGDTWAGGMTRPLGNGSYRLHVLVFYINGERHIFDWREFLVSEAINCYVSAIGRTDLVR